MLKFLVFADLHYKKGMYASTVEDLQCILNRAAEEKVDFVIHAGDFSNDYSGSPEIVNAYLRNPQNLPVYGIYGNHELETEGNTMDVVTPLLNNRDVCFGGEGCTYWSVDIKGWRIIGLDNNYSYNEQKQCWEHNMPASWGPPAGNLYESSLSPAQFAWLESTLADAAQKKLPVLVFSHAALSGKWPSTSEAEEIRKLFRKYQGTVRMCINGHLHTDHFDVIDGIPYFDVNTVRNGFWAPCDGHHYAKGHTYAFTDYDAQGQPCGTRSAELMDLVQATNTWFFKDPLSAIVCIDEDGHLEIRGSETSWCYDIAPLTDLDGVKTAIPDRTL